MKNITRQYWDIILMSDIVIDRVNLLVKYQQDILVFTCFNGRIIGDGDVEITGVYGGGDLNDSALKLRIKMISTIKSINSISIPSSRNNTFNNP